jgi:cyclophilin family peptidyl-prolyl cis-trans isomerase/HEAT repeat protein
MIGRGEDTLRRSILSIAFVTALAGGCATVPPPPAAPAAIGYDQKMAWILRLEDHRVLRDPALPPPAPAPARGKRPAVQLAPPQRADLGRLLADDEARVRRRAALAIGRVGLAEGVDLLLPRLQDPEPEVRQMVAFALGLLADRRAMDALRTALADASPLVQGRAAEALGLIGDQGSAAAIGAMVSGIVRAGSLASVNPDDLGYPLAPPAESFRLGVFALARLKAFDPLAAAVLDAQGQPVTQWWPVAYALGRTPDKRAVPALTHLLAAGPQSRVFAMRGLGALKASTAVPALLPFVAGWRSDPSAAIAALRALAEIGDPRAVEPLVALLQARDVPPNLRLETIAGLGTLRAAAAVTPLLDLVGDPWPPMRAAALRALRDIDLQQFLLVLSGLEPDRSWAVRAAMASLLGTLPADIAVPQLTELLKDPDRRVVPAVLDALVKVRAPRVERVLLDELGSDDVLVRAAAANGLGELKPPSTETALVTAYERGASDSLSAARIAALAALTKCGAAAATPTLKEALQDRDWAVRLRAAALLKGFDPGADLAAVIRPAPVRAGIDYAAPELVSPAVSPHAYVDTQKGTIEIELAVLDAPLTARNFMTLARAGFFTNVPIHRVVPNFVVQDGDPRGDGEGGPGYSIRDELNELPYLRGTVGMALDGADTGGSQFFITVGPQPHLDAKYTAFGRVVSGFDVVERLQQWDVIKQVRVWDGRTMK